MDTVYLGFYFLADDSTSPTGGGTGCAYSWQIDDITVAGTIIRSEIHDSITQISPLDSGEYTLYVYDETSCYSVESILIKTNAPLSIDTEIVLGPQCHGDRSGRIELNVLGGSGEYVYTWSTGETGNSISELAEGIYHVTISDETGCSLFQSYSVPSIEELKLDSVTIGEVACPDGLTGGIQPFFVGWSDTLHFAWSNGASAPFLTGIGSGDYQVTVTDGNGCTAIETFILSAPKPMEISSLTSSDVSCTSGSDGSIFLEIEGGKEPYLFSWNTGSSDAFIISVSAGTYFVTITDNNGCFITADYSINEPSPLSIELSEVVSPDCFGESTGSLSLSGRGGTTPYSFQWSTGDENSEVDNLQAGIYEVTMTDAQSCTVTGQFEIPASDPLELDFTSLPVSCLEMSDGSISISVDGGTAPYSYTWNQGSTEPVIVGLDKGIYTVTITDANGCERTDSIEVAPEERLELTTSLIELVSCAGASDGIIEVWGTGGTPPYRFAWNDGVEGFQRLGLPSGTYSVTISDDKGCTAVESFDVREPDLLQPVIVGFNDVSCFGEKDGRIDLLALGGTPAYNFQWEHGVVGRIVTDLAAGTYTVTLSDANSCEVVEDFTINEPEALMASGLITEDVLCHGDSTGQFSVVITGGRPPYTYLLNGEPAKMNGDSLGAGAYILEVFDSSFCASQISFHIHEPPMITISLEVTPSGENTATGMITAQISGGAPPYQYAWDGYPDEIGNALAGLPPGTYPVTVTDGNGCMISDSATIELSTATSEANLDEDIIIFPNPTSEKFKIKTSRFTSPQMEGVYNASYQRIDADILDTGIRGQEISLMQYPPGIYFIVLQYKGKRVIRKISLIR
jgi:hypothetical protein